ncbi:toll/interleukin-1 receptor domain-containing protein [Rhodoplanes roseus]|uniref:TIR domain-containing protein n=1 Tax=Rhodoplanes roseus TaxID=29409 RepID=A0A327KUA6_9BRAD|nr:toll/interleukin-1 receptor domain-containing protein [Rhodoplanes roseus]RAI41646.1 hypothetical protein CH341_21245 [Rhodoplanes roseus]
MMPKAKKPRSHPRPARSREVGIFISYASEDQDLAKDVNQELRKLFPRGIRIFFDRASLDAGSEFKDAIDAALDTSDILLILFSDQTKPSYSFTGYEAGFFSASKTKRPSLIPGVERVIIPFCIGSKAPAVTFNLQHINIDPDQVISLVEDPASFMRNEPKPLDDDNPVLRLLTRIAEIVGQAWDLGDRDAIRDNIRYAADRLYLRLFKYLQNRKCQEDIPERKVIIRTGPPAASRAELLANATVELEGGSFSLFGISEIPTRSFGWSQFLGMIVPRELASAWAEGLKLMVTAALERDFEDNYHVVASLRGDKAFRLFVSRVVTFYNGSTEIHVYVVEMKSKDYGDEITTRLLKGISVGLRFRFLVLEEQSPFTVAKLSYPVVKMKPAVTELLSQIRVVLRESREARLDEPDILARIFGGDGPAIVKRNLDTWNGTLAALEKAAHALLAASDADADPVKATFIAALRDFAEKTDAMNREFTARALQALADEIGDITGGTAQGHARAVTPAAEAGRAKKAG